jgi:hypothetical protein
MKVTKRSRISLVCAVTLALGLAAAPASAKPIERVHFVDVGSEVESDFCGDLTVRIDFDVRGSFLLNPHGPDGLAYGMETVHGTVSFTNVANGKTLTSVFNNVNKDLKVTDNGDGTLTILILATGSNKVYGPDGKLLFNDPGQIRFEILVDYGGTPTDPSDDEFIADLGLVKGSTGRNDLEGLDFCADIIQAFIG